jgi:hypothetical protein
MYENKDYDKKKYPKLMLNKMKVMGGLALIYTPLGIYLKESLHRGFHVCTNQGKEVCTKVSIMHQSRKFLE